MGEQGEVLVSLKDLKMHDSPKAEKVVAEIPAGKLIKVLSTEVTEGPAFAGFIHAEALGVQGYLAVWQCEPKQLPGRGAPIKGPKQGFMKRFPDGSGSPSEGLGLASASGSASMEKISKIQIAGAGRADVNGEYVATSASEILRGFDKGCKDNGWSTPQMWKKLGGGKLRFHAEKEAYIYWNHRVGNWWIVDGLTQQQQQKLDSTRPTGLGSTRPLRQRIPPSRRSAGGSSANTGPLRRS